MIAVGMITVGMVAVRCFGGRRVGSEEGIGDGGRADARVGGHTSRAAGRRRLSR